jgi:uncharacterized protein DUF6390
MSAVAGGVLFARYAYPPNRLGYCGPTDDAAVLEYGVTGRVDERLRDLARQFDGAWPYLELLARDAGLDPLDRAVVEAYWLGNSLLDRYGAGKAPHHSYHVFCVYPWLRLLGDDRGTGQALRVLDQCRIRWGRVVAVTDTTLEVETRHLTWDGRQLSLGDPAPEHATADGFLTGVRPGDTVALHWDWICGTLTPGQQNALEHHTATHLALANTTLARSSAG